MIRSKLIAAALALPLMIAGICSAQANIIALTIDGSGSIDATEFDQQRTGYINALNALLVPDGSNAIGVWQFSDTVQQVFPLTTISNLADKNNLIAALTGMIQIAGTTAIGDSITTATNAITGFTANCLTTAHCIIDVSTDGVNNTGADPFGEAQDAFNLGITVNCLGVGAGASCDFNNGFGTDFLAPSGFDAFEDAIRAKLGAELNVPEPMTLTLFGVGLLGAGFARRRAKKA